MHEIEITEKPSLTGEQQINCDFHSFINLFNIIFGELQLMAELAQTPEHFNALLNMCRNISTALRERTRLEEAVESFARFKTILRTETGPLLNSSRIAPDDRSELLEYHRLLLEILIIAEVRIRELQARLGRPRAWSIFPATELQQNLREVMQTIADSSRGRYRISFHSQQPEQAPAPDEYQLQMDFSPEKICMPDVFNDVIRDLTANARKYSPPGTRIHTRLQATEDKLLLTVEDEGCGIPDEEIPRVVQFGYRASNARTRPTNGGGFGLTKAWYICSGFNGRMWIASELKVGTRITIQIPVPDDIC